MKQTRNQGHIVTVLTMAFVIAIASSVSFVHNAFAAGDGSIKSRVVINELTVNGPVLGESDHFGDSVANIGDLNKDGVDDFAIGAPYDATGNAGNGAVHILFMNADGSVDSTAVINDATANGPDLVDESYPIFGTSVTGIGDLNEDGVIDIAVGASGDDVLGANRGAVYILFLNTDGSVDSTVKIDSSTLNGPDLSNDDFFGASLAYLGNDNVDGLTVLAVGAPQDDDMLGEPILWDAGALHILFLNTDGSVDNTIEINSGTENVPALNQDIRFGTSVADIGDLDGNGFSEIAVGASFAPGEDTTYRGAVYILFMDEGYSVASTVKIDETTPNGPAIVDYDEFGTSIAGIGDFDGDGVPDMAVGAYYDDGEFDESGTLYILLLNDDASVSSTIEINGSTLNGPTLGEEAIFGVSVAGAGDLNDDGIQDLLVGASGTSDYKGAAYLFFMDGEVDEAPPGDEDEDDVDEDNGGRRRSGSSMIVTPPHPNGTLINHNGTIYLIANQQRLPFRDSAEYMSHGYKFSQVVVASVSDMYLPEGAIQKAMAGALVLDKSDGKTVYMIGQNGTKRGFTTPAVFSGLGYSFTDLLEIDLTDYEVGEVIDDANEAHPEGALVLDNGTVWWVLGNQRQGFESEAVFNTYGFTFTSLVKANSADMSLPIGPAIKFRDGTLVSDMGVYYIISDGAKRRFASEQSLVNWGYGLSNVISTFVGHYQEGNSL